MSAILISGAGTGLGRELALAFSKKGYKVLLLGRREEPLQDTKNLIEEENGEAYIYKADLQAHPGLKSLAFQVTHEHPDLEILCNNAGVGAFGPLEELTEEEIRQCMDTNVLGTIYLTQAFLPFLKKQSSSALLNIISTAGLRGKTNESVYCASKFAVRGFTESLIKELEHTNVKATAVYMGGMHTPFWDDCSHIKDPTKFRSPRSVAQYILDHWYGQGELIIP